MMVDKNQYSENVEMIKHYSSVRAAVMSFSAPLFFAIAFFAVEVRADLILSSFLFLTQAMFFYTIMYVWKFLTLKISRLRSRAIRIEKGRVNELGLFEYLNEVPTPKKVVTWSKNSETWDKLILLFSYSVLLLVFLSILIEHSGPQLVDWLANFL